MADLVVWPGSGSLTEVSESTPFGFYDTDTTFISHSVNTAEWCAKRLGYPIMDVELQGQHFYTCFEEAVTEYCAIVNQYNIKNNISKLQGAPTSSNYTHKLVESTGRITISDKYGSEVGVGGSVDWQRAFVEVSSSQQVYDLQEVLAPSDATTIVIHHSGRAESNSAIKLTRGHTSLTAAVDMVIALKWLRKEENLQDKRILLLTEGRAEEQQLVIIQEQDGFHLCGDYDQVVQEEKIRQVIDDLNDRQNMVYDIVQERSAKDLPTTYKDVAPLLEDIKDPERQARKTLTQLENHKLIIGNCKVRNKVETKWYWINKLVEES